MRPYFSLQAYIYYVAAILVAGLHGLILGQAIELNSLLATVGTLGVLFLIAAAIYLIITPKITCSTIPLSQLQKRFIILDVSLYCSVALIIFLLQLFLFQHPLLTAVRVVVDILLVGYFASIDNVLDRQLHWFKEGDAAATADVKVIPLARKFSLVFTSSLFLLTVVLALSALQTMNNAGIINGENSEIGFIFDSFTLFSLIMALSLRLVHAYTRNLQVNLNTQKEVLQAIQEGDLESTVPIMTQDELGVIALQINRMIDHLRDRERLHRTLESIVGPNIMEKLLTTDDETLKKGQQHDVAIMFCDMRDFTQMSENASTEEVIFFLNSFFADLSEIVSKNNGIINKFMGDAILAVYGLESDTNPVEDAINTAIEILEHTQMFTMPDGSHPDMGAGIHYGTVVAGTIGSEQRYEYTFLGDAVNTASRLEGLTKRLGHKIIVSKLAYNRVNNKDLYLNQFNDLGTHRVRGKSEPIHVYGTAP